MGACAHSRSRSAPARRTSGEDAPTARNGRASLRYNQGPNGSNTLLDEDAAAGCIRDGTTRSGLQPHPPNEHHGHPAAHGSDQSIVRPEKAQAPTRRGYQNLHSFLLPERFYTAKTQTGHEPAALAAMHGPDLLYSRDPWSGVSAIKPREFITLVGGAAAGAGGLVLH